MEQDCLSGVLFLDLKKAFDTVDHKIAINLLSNMNISPATLKWFKDYLSERKQITKLNGIESSELQINWSPPGLHPRPFDIHLVH